MTDTIRERIIEAVVTKLWEVSSSRGYRSDAGANVRLVDPRMSPDDCPAIDVWPGEETVTLEYGLHVCDMQIRVEALALIGSGNPALISEQLLGDIIEAMTGIKWTVPFTAGGPTEPHVGDTITGATSGATGYVEGVTVTAGSWAGSNAAGSFSLRRATGVFAAGEILKIGGVPVATVASAPSAQNPTVTTTGSLADRIVYVQGGPTSYPEAREIVTGSSATVSVRYKTPIGNPYAKG